MEIKRIGVIGAGTMGSGIAQVAAHVGGLNVIMNDISDEFVDKGFAVISKNLDRLISKEKLTAVQKDEILGRIRKSTRIEDMKEADFVIEAALENLDLKLDIFRKLDKVCQPGVILATNTSSISITKIAAATKRPESVIGMHFFNPVPLMKLVEAVKGMNTSEETFRTTCKLAEQFGKAPVGVNDSPGFIVNRMLIPMINEAIYVLYEGIGTAEDIDKAMKLGVNHPMGPLELADLIGLDVCLSVMEVLYSGFADSKYRPCPLLKKYVDAGYLGKKVRRGFYNYGENYERAPSKKLFFDWLSWPDDGE